MRLTILFMFCASALFSQTKTSITFEDESTMIFEGKSIGDVTLYNYFSPTEIDNYVKNYYRIDGDTIEIFVYSENPSHVFEDLFIYRIHKNQVNLEEWTIQEIKNDKGVLKYYNLQFSALEGKDFHHKKHKNSVEGEPSDFVIFNVSSNQTGGLEELLTLVMLQ